MDIEVSITVSTISYETWLKTSYMAFGVVDDNGKSIVGTIEIGPDQKDVFTTFMNQAVREILKSFTSRQGDVNGTPFEYDGTTVIYRFNEGEPVLPQAAALKINLNEDVKNAIFTYVTLLWFKFRGNEKYTNLFMTELAMLQASIQGSLYLLHD